jgi:uncharacterized protein YegJ (DUF2314 family)
MRRILLLAIAVTIASAVSCAPSQSRPKDDPIASVQATDSEMNAAIAKARESLPKFFERWKHPGPGESDFNLKLKFTEGDNVEHIWIGQLEGSPGRITGVVNDTPENIHSVKLGQRIPIPEDRISDWLYLRNGKMVGNWTVRALFKKMSPEEVKSMKARLADP